MLTDKHPCENCEAICNPNCAKWNSWFKKEWERICAQFRRPKPIPRKKTIYDHERSFFVYENPNVTRQRMKIETDEEKGE